MSKNLSNNPVNHALYTPVDDLIMVGSEPLKLNKLLRVIPNPAAADLPTVGGPTLDVLFAASHGYTSALSGSIEAMAAYHAAPSETAASACQEANNALFYAEVALYGLLGINRMARMLNRNISSGDVIASPEDVTQMYAAGESTDLDDLLAPDNATDDRLHVDEDDIQAMLDALDAQDTPPDIDPTSRRELN